MVRRPHLAILLIALIMPAVAACGSAATGDQAGRTVTTTVTVTRPPAPRTTRSAAVTTTTAAAAATTTAATATRTTSTPSTVSFKAFTGEWVGHTRMVDVSSSGRLEEHVGDGCCDPVIDLVLQLSNPRRSGGGWVATSQVLSAKVHPGWKQTGLPAPKPGDAGTVTIGADHILVDSITTNGFCDPDKTAPGTCGA